MAFNWSNKATLNKTEEKVCKLQQEKQQEKMPSNSDESSKKIVLGRVVYKTVRIGCCGMSRYDMIFPVGDVASFSQFKQEGFNLINDFNKDQDSYQVEFFEGIPEQNERGNGKQLYSLIHKDGVWHFYKDGILKLETDNERILSLWEDLQI